MKKKLGSWKINRKSDSTIEVEIPEGMKITGSNLDIDDLLDAIQRFKVIKHGVQNTSEEEITVKCCHGGIVIA